MIWTGLPSQLLLLHLHQLFVLRRRPFSEVVRGLRVSYRPACRCACAAHVPTQKDTHFYFYKQYYFVTSRMSERVQLAVLPAVNCFLPDMCFQSQTLALKKKPAMFKDTQQLAARNEQLATHSRSLAVSPSFGSMKPRSGESPQRTHPVCVCVHINQSVFYSEHGVWS